MRRKNSRKTRLKELLAKMKELDKKIFELTRKVHRERRRAKRAKIREEIDKLENELSKLKREAESYIKDIVEELRKIHSDFEGLNKILPYNYVDYNYYLENPSIIARTHYLYVKTIEELEKIVEEIKEKVCNKYKLPVILRIDRRYDHFPLPLEERWKLKEKGYEVSQNDDFVVTIEPDK